jgi:SAM-dependent methyltransferase
LGRDEIINKLPPTDNITVEHASLETMAGKATTAQSLDTVEKRKASGESTEDTRKRQKTDESYSHSKDAVNEEQDRTGSLPATLFSERQNPPPPGTVDWKTRLQYHPGYPVSLRYQISKHHGNQNDGAFGFAHDVGTGSGGLAAELASMFDHVHVSDANTSNLAEARGILSKLSKTGTTAVSGKACTFSFSQHGDEEAHLATAPDTVDLMTIMETAPWMDVDKLMDAAFQTLRSNGTLAIVTYSPRVFIKNSSRADRALGEVMRRVRESTVEKLVEDQILSKKFERAEMGLDFVPLDKNKWCLAKSRRVRLNGRGKGRFPHSILEDSTGAHLGGMRVQDEEAYLHFDYGEGDPEAVGWQKNVSKEWFRPYISTTNLGHPQDVSKIEEFALLEKVLEEEFPGDGQDIVVEWVVDLVLATKK